MACQVCGLSVDYNQGPGTPSSFIGSTFNFGLLNGLRTTPVIVASS